MSLKNMSLIVNETSQYGQHYLLTSEDVTSGQDQTIVKIDLLWYALLALASFVGLLVSLVSNMMIIYIFWRTPTLRTPSSILVLNLCVSDLVYCVQMPIVIHNCLTKNPPFNDRIGCQMLGFLSVATAVVSIITIAAMSVERCYVILYPISGRKRFSMRVAFMVTVMIWIYALMLSIPPLFGRFNRYVLDPSSTTCTLDYLTHRREYKLYIEIFFVMVWVLPATTMIISYTLIIVAVRRSRNELREARCSKDHSAPDGLYHIGATMGQDEFHLPSQLPRCSLSMSQMSSTRLPFSNHRSDRQQQQFHRRLSLSSMSVMRHGFELDRGIRIWASTEVKEPVVSHSPSPDTSKSVILKVNCVVGQLESTSSLYHQVCPLGITINNNRDANTNQPERGANIAVEDKRKKMSSASIEEDLDEDDQLSSHCMSIFKFRPKRVPGKQPEPPNRVRAQISNQSSLDSTSKKSTNFGSENGGTITRTIRLTNKTPICSRSGRNRRVVHKRKLIEFRLAKMSFYLILLWAISWTPIGLIAIFNALYENFWSSPASIVIASCLTKMGPAFDVFVYGISHPKIRSKFKQILFKKLSRPSLTNR